MRAECRARLAAVKLFATDVDGVLTDGSIWLGPEGETKRFHVADGLGLQLLRSAGIATAWISGRSSTAVSARGEELQIDYVLQGIHDKVHALSSIARELNLRLDEIAFMGDDLNDLAVLGAVGCSLAPADAAAQVRAVVSYVCKAVGGHGAVREACERILEAQGCLSRAISLYICAAPAADAGRPVSLTQPPPAKTDSVVAPNLEE